MKQSKEQLLKRKKELIKRLTAIRADIANGLAADSKEQAIELENMEVLQEIYRLADNELQSIEQQLADLN